MEIEYIILLLYYQLFPIGYLPKNSSLQLANPLAVDYDLYEKKVSEALDQYNRFVPTLSCEITRRLRLMCDPRRSSVAIFSIT